MYSEFLGRIQAAFDSMVKRPVVADMFDRVVLENDLPATVYWRVAPRVHRWRRYLLAGYVDRPLDPFKLLSVDPDRIVRFSGRELPNWHDHWHSFGSVLDGDWDMRTLPPSPWHDGPDPSLYFAARFSDSPIHEALEAHFVDGVPWEETAFIREVLRRTRGEEGNVWHTCSTPAEVRQRCRSLDRLYGSLRERGCISFRELNVERGFTKRFRQVMENEILVDIGRNGEILFVNGRHRLSLAKILGLNHVPVAVVVRHPGWIDRRSELLRGRDGESDTDSPDRPESVHPDLRSVWKRQ